MRLTPDRRCLSRGVQPGWRGTPAALVVLLAFVVLVPLQPEARAGSSLTIAPDSISFHDTPAADEFTSLVGDISNAAGTVTLSGPNGPAVAAVNPPDTAAVFYGLMAPSVIGTMFLEQHRTAYQFVPDRTAINALVADETVQVPFTFTDDDATVTVTVTANGADDDPILQLAARPDITAELPGPDDDGFVHCGTATPDVAGYPYRLVQGSSPDGETCDLAFDGATGTKYLNYSETENAVAIDAQRPYIVTGLQLYTANDGEWRDPTGFELLGWNSSFDDHASGLVVATGTVSPPWARQSEYPAVTFANTTPYRYYLLRFTSTRRTDGAADGDALVQVSRIVLPGVLGTGSPIYVLGDADPVVIEPDLAVLQADRPTPSIAGASVSVPGPDDALHVDIASLGVGGITVAGQGTNTLTLSGPAPPETYTTVLSAVAFSTTGVVGSRDVSWSLTDVRGLTATGMSNVVITATVPDGPPRVVTRQANATGPSTATVTGEVTGDGNFAVTERGFLYATAGTLERGAPGVVDVQDGAVGTGTFSTTLSELLPATRYLVRAYAVNERGTGYGTIFSFTMAALSIPPPTLAPPPEPEPEPVRDESTGRLPESGGAAGTVDGLPVVLEVERTVTGGVSVSGPGFGIEVTPNVPVGPEEPGLPDEGPGSADPGASDPEDDPAAGRPPADEDAEVVFTRGRAAQVRLQGFAPSSPVRVWLFSEPRLLGSFTTDASGALEAATEALSDEVSACPHTLHVEGRLPGGRQAAVSLGVWVEAGVLRFADTVGSPAARAVQCLWDLDIVAGYADGSFGTNRVVTRQAMAAFLHRLAGEPVPAVLDWFEDVGADHPFRVPIAWMAQEGLANGFEDGRFHPNREVTRQAVAAFIYRQSGQPQADLGAPFSDVGRAHPFSREIGWLAGEGITRGYTDGSFRPSEPVRRGPLARLLVRAFDPMGIEP